MLEKIRELPASEGFPAKGFYLHQDGGIYELIGSGIHSEDGTTLCVYLHVWPFEQGLWLRPVEMWTPARFAPLSADEAKKRMEVLREQARAEISLKRGLRKQKEHGLQRIAP